jgi:2-hydroxychromene-2-carboxylate isomerase
VNSRPVDFYFDYISPNAYIAWVELRRLAPDYGLEIRPIPVLFAGLLGASGRKGPAEYEPMRRWMMANVMRKCAVLEIPLQPPAFHPFNPLVLLRLTALDMPAGRRLDLIDRLFSAVWARSLDTRIPERIGPCLQAGGFDAASMLGEIGSTGIKNRVRTNTDEALNAGVFGVPSVVVDQQVFYGYDDFPYFIDHLEGRDPVNADSIRAWDRIEPSATRRT